MPFLAVGPGVKANYTGTVAYTHSSIIKSVERILGLPILSTVSSANDLHGSVQRGVLSVRRRSVLRGVEPGSCALPDADSRR